jgi:hypothetical protein
MVGDKSLSPRSLAVKDKSVIEWRLRTVIIPGLAVRRRQFRAQWVESKYASR